MNTERSRPRVDYRKAVTSRRTYYGKHLMTNAVSCNERLLDFPTATEPQKGLVPRIDMIGAVALHTADTVRDPYSDFFGCKWYDEATMCEVENTFFSPDEITEQIALRS